METNLKIEIESLLIADHNIAIRINDVIIKIDNTQQNIKCNLRRDRD